MWSSRQRASIPMWLACQRLLPAYKLALHVNVPTCLACQGVIVSVFSSSAKRIHAENVTLSGFWDVLKIRYKVCSKMTSQESPNYVSYEHHPEIFLGTSLHNSRENAETDFLFSYVTLRKFRETLF